MDFISVYIDGLVEDCSNFSAMELLQSCSKPLKWYVQIFYGHDCNIFLIIAEMCQSNLDYEK